MIAIQQGNPAPELTPALRDQVMGDLHRWRVHTVVVGPMYNQATMLEFFTRLFGNNPQQVEGVYVWWEVPS
jgi:hypothetical protein